MSTFAAEATVTPGVSFFVDTFGGVTYAATKITIGTTGVDNGFVADGNPLPTKLQLGGVNVSTTNPLTTSIIIGGAAISTANPMPVTGQTAHDNPVTGNPVRIGFKASTGYPPSVTNGDAVEAFSDDIGRQHVRAHGALEHDSPTVGTIPPVTVAARAWELESSAPGLVSSDGDVSYLLCDRVGRVYARVAGDIEHNEPDTLNSPVKIGGKASDNLPAAVNVNDRVNAWFDTRGRQHNVVHRDQIQPVSGTDSFLPAKFLTNAGSVEMNVNGSVTVVNFDYQVPSLKKLRVYSLRFVIRDAGIDPVGFGGLVTLANGLAIQIIDTDGSTIVLDFLDGQTIKNNFQFGWLGSLKIDVASVGDDTLTAVIDLSIFADRMLTIGGSQRVRVKVQDNLTGLTEFRTAMFADLIDA